MTHAANNELHGLIGGQAIGVPESRVPRMRIWETHEQEMGLVGNRGQASSNHHLLVGGGRCFI